MFLLERTYVCKLSCDRTKRSDNVYMRNFETIFEAKNWKIFRKNEKIMKKSKIIIFYESQRSLWGYIWVGILLKGVFRWLLFNINAYMPLNGPKPGSCMFEKFALYNFCTICLTNKNFFERYIERKKLEKSKTQKFFTNIYLSWKIFYLWYNRTKSNNFFCNL